MVYLDINGKVFDSMREEGVEKAKENLTEEEYSDEVTFDSSLLEATQEDLAFDSSSGVINYSGTLTANKDGKSLDFGYISLDVDLDLDVVTEVVNYYMKKLGKLKTVLEATK